MWSVSMAWQSVPGLACLLKTSRLKSPSAAITVTRRFRRLWSSVSMLDHPSLLIHTLYLQPFCASYAACESAIVTAVLANQLAEREALIGLWFASSVARMEVALYNESAAWRDREGWLTPADTSDRQRVTTDWIRESRSMNAGCRAWDEEKNVWVRRESKNCQKLPATTATGAVLCNASRCDALLCHSHPRSEKAPPTTTSTTNHNHIHEQAS